MPADKLLIETDAPRFDGAVPGVPESVNHDCVFVADHVKVPPPVVVIPMFCDAGFEPPAVAENVRLEDPTVIAGGASLTTNVTPTNIGDPTAPVAATVIVSV